MDNQIVEKLIVYAREKLYLHEIDEVYVQNQVLSLLNISQYEKSVIDLARIRELVVPDVLIKELREYIINRNLCEGKEIDILVDKIFGVLTPVPSNVQHIFAKVYHESSAEACKFLYNLQIANNYIPFSALKKNITWADKRRVNALEISINLAKPEKDNQEIAKLKAEGPKEYTYPLCSLCIENLGYAGRDDYPARNTLRTISLKLTKDEYFMQFSPYSYFPQHCIIIKRQHQDMEMNRQKFANMFDFIECFPNYFIGSNAELPIVGGSILNHEHFQGGNYVLPMMKAGIRFSFVSEKYKEVKIDYLDWYNSVICLSGGRQKPILDLAEEILSKFRHYDNLGIDLISHSKETQYSTVTPIARKVKGQYYLYLILRNNRVNEKHPEGIFHAHREYHMIKKEGIGLIEAMGLFILPPRIHRAMNSIVDILQGYKKINNVLKPQSDMMVYRSLIEDLVAQYGCGNTVKKAKQIAQQAIENICYSILENTAIFKNTLEGNNHVLRFMEYFLDLKLRKVRRN